MKNILKEGGLASIDNGCRGSLALPFSIKCIDKICRIIYNKVVETQIKTVAKSPAGAERRRMYSSCGKFSRKGAIHIELFFDVLGALGSVASILGFVMYLIDKTNKKKK